MYNVFVFKFDFFLKFVNLITYRLICDRAYKRMILIRNKRIKQIVKYIR